MSFSAFYSLNKENLVAQYGPDVAYPVQGTVIGNDFDAAAIHHRVRHRCIYDIIHPVEFIFVIRS